jgi:hypothetical protein
VRLLVLQFLSAIFEKGLFTARLAYLVDVFHPLPATFVGIDRHLEGARPQHLCRDAERGGGLARSDQVHSLRGRKLETLTLAIKKLDRSEETDHDPEINTLW